MRISFTGSSGNELAADCVGRWDDPLVLLLHGGGQTRFAWGGTADVLANSGYLALTLDLRGHGDSDWVADGDYSIDAFASDVRSVVERLDRPATLVGASLGGLTSLVAVGEPPRVDCTSLILVDVVPQLSEEGKTSIMSFMLADPDGFATIEQASAAVASYLPHRPRPSDARGLVKNLRRREDGRYYWHWDPQVLASSRSPRHVGVERLEAALRNTAVPILLVRGAQSEIVREEDLVAFRAVAPTAEFVDVPGASHMVAGDKNDVFTTAVLGFLGQQRA